VADAPPSPVKARILAQRVRFDMLATRYDADQVRAALSIAEALGLDELRSHVLISAGTVRAGRGEDQGFEQLAQGTEIARAGNWLYAIDRGATNLGAQNEVRGHAREALAAYAEAMRAAERMGSQVEWRMTRGNLIQGWGETGEWDLAGTAADEFLAESERVGPHYLDAAIAGERASLRLGRGDFDGAAADVAFALERGGLDDGAREFFARIGATRYAEMFVVPSTS
jgi:hypothetical protein